MIHWVNVEIRSSFSASFPNLSTSRAFHLSQPLRRLMSNNLHRKQRHCPVRSFLLLPLLADSNVPRMHHPRRESPLLRIFVLIVGLFFLSSDYVFEYFLGVVLKTDKQNHKKSSKHEVKVLHVNPKKSPTSPGLLFRLVILLHYFKHVSLFLKVKKRTW